MEWLIFLGVVGFLIIKQTSLSVWAIIYGVLALLEMQYGQPGLMFKISLWTGFALLLFLLIPPVRQKLISKPIMHQIRRILPHMSQTERVALEAGTVGWDAEIFSGSPDFNLLQKSPITILTAEEQAFLDGPVHALCRMVDDWDITHNHTDLPSAVWAYIKENGFLGMIIPKQYGGLELSATAQSAVLVKLYTVSGSVATTVSVPNSLGPAELLLKYGTETQKNYYLPRLAKGIDVPCFALTGPTAGSDAASIPDTGIVCREIKNGQEVLGIRLNWNKRYITLCPVATVIGLAFRLFDPENLLGKGEDVGITCALIPSETPGVIKGRRHFPLNIAFLNGPTQGENVFVPIDCLIGGPAMAGHGWRMLMECLSAGRAISLPSSAVGGAQAASLGTGAYARIRKQFNLPIGKFEGIEEPLARIAGNTYMMDAALTMTLAAIDVGEKPSVAGAILKYHTTERARQISIDAMDILGGKGICLGPNNFIGRGYQTTPISITVEGANILTRNLIIFGQGAIRCHPYVYKEMKSIADNNLKAFDRAFWGHATYIFSNLLQSVLYSFTGARMTHASQKMMRRYYQLIHLYSSNLALLADFSMITIGANLKRREKISARLGDVLSDLYLASAVLKRFHHDGAPLEDKPLIDWCCQELLYSAEQAIQGVIRNFPIRWARVVLRLLLQPFGLRQKKPSDQLGQIVAKLMMEPGEARSRLTRYAFAEAIDTCPLGRLESAFRAICEVEPLEKSVSDAVKKGKITSLSILEQIQEALQYNVLTQEEAIQLTNAETARQRAIAVDDFDDSELRRPKAKEAVKKYTEVSESM
jgi:acyl-CoA dehydrogenase